MDGVIGGVQTGYNYQFGTWVFGLETDIQASGQKGGSTFPVLALPPSALTTDHKLQWFGTTRPLVADLSSEPRAACSRKRPSSLGTTDERSSRGPKVWPPPELAAVLVMVMK